MILADDHTLELLILPGTFIFKTNIAGVTLVQILMFSGKHNVFTKFVFFMMNLDGYVC